MKILQVSTHLDIGGIGNYIVSLSKALRNMGQGVIVASSGGELEEELRDSGIEHRKINIKTKFEYGPKVLISAFNLCRIIKDEKVDIIHAHTRVSQVAARLASGITGVPYVTTCHGFFKTRSRKIFDTWGVKVIAISNAVKAHLKDDLGVDEDRIALIYSGVDIGRFSERYSNDRIESVKRSLGLGAGPVVGSIGRLSPVKGQKFLIEAVPAVLSEAKDTEFVIVGSGPDEATLKNLARSLGVERSVLFLRSAPDTHKFLSIMDVFVLPSVKEGLGIALLEALVSGKACVASKVGGISDVIDDGVNGLLIEACKPETIAAAVLRLIKDPALRDKLGQKGNILAKEKFSLDMMAGNVNGLYRNILEKGKKYHEIR